MHSQPIAQDTLYADACAVLRPTWNGEQVTDMQEFFTLATYPASVLLLALSALAIWHGSIWLIAPTCLGWAIWMLHIYGAELLHDPYFTALESGCIGSSVPFIAGALALCAALTYRAWQAR